MSDVDLLADLHSAERVGLGVANGCLVVTIQVDLTGDTVRQMQADVLARIQDGGIRGAVLDVSVIQVLDTRGFGALVETARMVRLLGVPSVIVGLQAGVAASIVALETDFSGLRMARTLDDAFALLGGASGTSGRGRWQ